MLKEEDVKTKFGVKPSKVIDVQSLAGDSSDNVPGVPGIGVKTAAELINKYGTLEKLLNKAHEIKQYIQHIIDTEKDPRIWAAVKEFSSKFSIEEEQLVVELYSK